MEKGYVLLEGGKWGGAYVAMFAWSCGVWWDVRTVVGGSTVHKGLDGLLVPFNTIVLLRMMTMLFLSRWAVQPWSHRSPIESSAPVGKSGKTCAFLAAGGRVGRRSSQVWVEVTCFPSGIFTEIGWRVGWRLMCGWMMEM